MLTLDIAPAAPPGPVPAGRVVNTWRDAAGQPRATAFASGTRRWIDWPNLGRFEFTTDSRTVCVVPAPGVPREVVESTFVGALQPIILQAQGWQALHASAVATGFGVVALCGEAGSGKSTLAAALARAGLPQVADDALVFACRDDRVSVQPLPFASQVPADARAHLDRLDPPGRSDDGFRLAPSDTPAQLTNVVVLSRGGAGARAAPALTPLSAVDAFSALLAHAHCFDRDDRAHTRLLVDHYLMVSAQVPVHRLEYPEGFDRLREVLALVMGVERRRGAGFFPAVRDGAFIRRDS
jgi:hypothetical protein